MARDGAVYACQSCGAVHTKWAGQCTACGTWNSLVEEITSRPPGALAPTKGSKQRGLSFETLETQDPAPPRIATGVEEFDRVWRARVAKAGPAPWERLEAMIEAYFTAEVFSAEKLAVWFSFWVDADLRDQFRSASVKVERRYHREIEPEIVRLLEAAQTGDTAKEAARFTGMLTAMVDGYWLQALLYPKTFRAKAAVTACLDFLRLAVERTAA